MNAPQREEFRHFLKIPVRWGDVDMLGHVNNVQFFRFAESARIEYFEALVGNDPDFWKTSGFILASIGCDFLAQLRYPATLDVGTRVVRVGRSSMHLEHGMFLGEQALARVQAVLVWFDYVNQRPMKVPDHARSFIRGIERGQVEEA